MDRSTLFEVRIDYIIENELAFSNLSIAKSFILIDYLALHSSIHPDSCCCCCCWADAEAADESSVAMFATKNVVAKAGAALHIAASAAATCICLEG